MKKQKTIRFLLCALALAATLGACSDSKEAQVLKPIARHITGRWKLTKSLEMKDGKWVEAPLAGEAGQIYNYQADGTLVLTNIDPKGTASMKSMRWSADDEQRTLTYDEDCTVKLLRLTADEFEMGYHFSTDEETGAVSEGEFSWLMTRADREPLTLAESLVGRWLYVSTYEKKDGTWTECNYGRPDEGWHRYQPDGTAVSYSRMGSQEQTATMKWTANQRTGTVVWTNPENEAQTSTLQVEPEGDDTLNVLYSKNFDPATGQVVEGEFKDVMKRVE